MFQIPQEVFHFDPRPQSSAFYTHCHAELISRLSGSNKAVVRNITQARVALNCEGRKRLLVALFDFALLCSAFLLSAKNLSLSYFLTAWRNRRHGWTCNDYISTQIAFYISVVYLILFKHLTVDKKNKFLVFFSQRPHPHWEVLLSARPVLA